MHSNHSLGKSHIRQVLESRGIHPSKSLGQNFLVDPNVARRIVKISGIQDGDRVLEIGAGLGSLTVELAGAGAKVVAVEFDRNLIDILREHTYGQEVQIVHGDAMKMDFKELLEDFDPAGKSWTMVSNLPYNIATPLVISMLTQVPRIKKMVIMVQKEVAQRFIAKPNTKEYGASTLKIAYFANCKLEASFSPNIFLPVPNIESALVTMERNELLPTLDYKTFSDMVNAGFANRRKMLRTTLSQMLSPFEIESAGVDPSLRGEALNLEHFMALSSAFKAKQSSCDLRGES